MMIMSYESYLSCSARCGQKYAPVLSNVRDTGLLGDWSLIREWGRVGSPGTVRKDWFETEEEALTARHMLFDAKRKKGYQTIL